MFYCISIKYAIVYLRTFMFLHFTLIYHLKIKETFKV